MVANAGRQVTFLFGDESPQVEIEGVREKGIALNSEPIDISSDDSAGWRELLDLPAENQVDLSIQGVTKSSTLRDAWFAGEKMNAATIEFPNGASLSGNFYMASYKETANYKEAVAFEMELQSSGAVTYTPAP